MYTKSNPYTCCFSKQDEHTSVRVPPQENIKDFLSFLEEVVLLMFIYRSPSTNVTRVTSDVEMWWGGLWWHLGISARYGLSITPDMTPLGNPHLCTYIDPLQASPPGKTTQPQIWQVNNINFFVLSFGIYVLHSRIKTSQIHFLRARVCGSFFHPPNNFSDSRFSVIKNCENDSSKLHCEITEKVFGKQKRSKICTKKKVFPHFDACVTEYAL